VAAAAARRQQQQQEATGQAAGIAAGIERVHLASGCESIERVLQNKFP
jgi:hypothetical protein